MSEEIQLELYVVRNQEGKFFRSKGYGGYGDTWVDDIQKAKIYPKISQARSRVTWFYNNYPKYGIPSIIKLGVCEMEVLDETERVEKAHQRKLTEKDRSRIRQAKWELDRAERELENAQQRLNREQQNVE